MPQDAPGAGLLHHGCARRETVSGPTLGTGVAQDVPTDGTATGDRCTDQIFVLLPMYNQSGAASAAVVDVEYGLVMGLGCLMHVLYTGPEINQP